MSSAITSSKAFIPGTTGWTAADRSIECFILDGKDYRLDQSGRDGDELRTSLLPGLAIPLKQVWED